MKRVDVYLPETVYDALRLEAKKRRQSVSYHFPGKPTQS